MAWQESFNLSIQKLWWLLLLSFIYLLIFIFIFKVSGDYENSRVNNVSAIFFTKKIVRFVIAFFKIQLLPLSIIIIYFIISFNNNFKLQVYSLVSNKLFLLGLISMILSMIPFVIGGRSVYTEGWNVRFLSYSSFPFAFLYVSFIDSLNERGYHLRLFLLIFLLVYQLFGFWKHNIDWQIRWLRDAELINFINKEIKEDIGLVVIFDSSNPIFNEEIRWYENTGYVQKALNRNDIIGSGKIQFKDFGYNIVEHKVNIRSFTYGKYLVQEENPKKCKRISLDSSFLYSLSIIKKLNTLLQFYFTENSLNHEDFKLKLIISSCKN